ncbi:MAG: hypothetical protein J5I62_00485 [Flavobacteriales bacterium]|nr:hypothetical protein [Flavobacteriales bacterium]MEB2342450.1 addiction module protein [Flavobacteriia bacterium]
MDIALKKLDLVQRLLSIWDEAALNRVAQVIEKEASAEEILDLTEEEIAELDRRRARYLSGESKPYTVEESMRIAREGPKP